MAIETARSTVIRAPVAAVKSSANSGRSRNCAQVVTNALSKIRMPVADLPFQADAAQKYD